MTRISCGIADLNKRLQGGFPIGESILLTGEAGTGKTLFGIQFLHSACKAGKKCIMIATEEIPEKIVVHSKYIGFDLKPFVDNNQLTFIRYLEIRASNIEEFDSNVCLYIDDLNNLIHITQDDIEVVVLDNLGTFAIGTELKKYREKIDILTHLLSNQKKTSLIMIDATAHELTHRIAEYSTYGTIRMMIKENPYTGKIERFMYIPKMRGTKISLELINYDITEEGIKLLSARQNRQS